MTLLYLIRHGQAQAPWDQQRDPALDEIGRRQAQEMARRLSIQGRMPILTSPLSRTRETASALEQRWNREALVEPRLTEIPTPGLTLEERGAWLGALRTRTWDEMEEPVTTWRRELIEHLCSLRENTAVVTHFMAINVAVGWARQERRVLCCHPMPCSITILERIGASLRLVQAGAEGGAAAL